LDDAALKDHDTDNDGTLDHNEYAKVVAIEFKAADVDGDGTLDANELSTSSGAVLLKLIQ
jgi:Ca2+-binding EF-hand superfamily protein